MAEIASEIASNPVKSASIKQDLQSYWSNIAAVLQSCLELASAWKPFIKTSNPKLTAEFFQEMIPKGEACHVKSQNLVDMHQEITTKYSDLPKLGDLGKEVKRLEKLLYTHVTTYEQEWNEIKIRGGSVPVEKAKLLARDWIETQECVKASKNRVTLSADDIKVCGGTKPEKKSLLRRLAPWLS